ncbi:hypothetical protein PsYK624_118990 [Phanerochaete sordida]|uniref:Uncharacterized protein n=1 Tax=Phanerochaete sordida TaxID=48140 RepID=A0A9P3LI43_9APHY|nr:hypothetical protein PsYK624_118990 [Phanerochaete sordida]
MDVDSSNEAFQHARSENGSPSSRSRRKGFLGISQGTRPHPNRDVSLEPLKTILYPAYGLTGRWALKDLRAEGEARR